jgi:hypothetical protein
VQVAGPFVALYVPGGHAEHCPLEAPVSGPVYPVLHEHSIVDEQYCMIFCAVLLLSVDEKFCVIFCAVL